ncbi:hypothetical protein ACQP1W_16890 [Spirillospora sp. CA-255316]
MLVVSGGDGAVVFEPVDGAFDTPTVSRLTKQVLAVDVDPEPPGAAVVPQDGVVDAEQHPHREESFQRKHSANAVAWFRTPLQPAGSLLKRRIAEYFLIPG